MSDIDGLKKAARQRKWAGRIFTAVTFLILIVSLADYINNTFISPPAVATANAPILSVTEQVRKNTYNDILAGFLILGFFKLFFGALTVLVNIVSPKSRYAVKIQQFLPDLPERRAMPWIQDVVLPLPWFALAFILSIIPQDFILPSIYGLINVNSLPVYTLPIVMWSIVAAAISIIVVIRYFVVHEEIPLWRDWQQRVVAMLFLSGVITTTFKISSRLGEPLGMLFFLAILWSMFGWARIALWIILRLIRSGQFERALNQIAIMERIRPAAHFVFGGRHLPVMAMTRANTYIASNRTEEGKQEMLRTLDLTQRAAGQSFQGMLLSDLAVTYLDGEEYDEAIRLAEGSLEMTPGWQHAVYVKATALVLMEPPRPDEAKELLHHLINDQKLIPHITPYIQVALGQAYALLGEVEDADHALAEALKPHKPPNKPGTADVHVLAALASIHLNRPDEAKERLQRAVEYSDHVLRSPFYIRVQAHLDERPGTV